MQAISPSTGNDKYPTNPMSDDSPAQADRVETDREIETASL